MAARTYKGRTLPAALNLVRRELGDEAVIVSVTERSTGVEVVAASSQSRKGMRQLFERMRASKTEAQPAPVAVGAEDLATVRLEPGMALSELEGDGMEVIEELEALDDMVPARRGHVPEVERPSRPERTGRPGLRVVGSKGQSASPLALALESMDLPPDLAARVASAAGQGPQAWARVLNWLERKWPIPEPPVAHPSDLQALAFLGPAGVGRSTLIHGLASRAVIDEPGRVVIVQIGFPGRRVSTLGELDAPVGVELRRANYPEELRRVVLDHRDVSAVLLDLPSIDLREEGELFALKRFVTAVNRSCPEVSWHTVIPANWSTREATRTVRALDFANLAGIAWTHLDRVGDPGTIVATTLRTDVPPSFLHGDPRGTGEQSGAAGWDGIVEWLGSESKAER